ncbi:MAG: hypothetical protein AB8G11_04020 [Saprospiraceae bacterium]
MIDYYLFDDIDNGFDMDLEDYKMFNCLRALPTNQGDNPNRSLEDGWQENNWTWLHRMIFTSVINKLQTVVIPLDVLFRFHKGLMYMSLSNDAILNGKASHVYGRDLKQEDMEYIVEYEKLLRETIKCERRLFDKRILDVASNEMMRIIELNEVELAKVFWMYKKGEDFQNFIFQSKSEMVVASDSGVQSRYRNTTPEDYDFIESPIETLSDLVNAKGLWFSNSKVAFISTHYDDMWTQTGFKDASHLLNAAASCLRMMATLSQRIEEGNVYWYIAGHLFNSYLSISETIRSFRTDPDKMNGKYLNKPFESAISQSAYKEADKYRLEFLGFFVTELMKKEVNDEV